MTSKAMTSQSNSEPATGVETVFVWIWLPQETEPVVCGRLDDDRGRIAFTYARSYLDRAEAVAIYNAELPLLAGSHYAADGDRLPLCIDDAMPDSWGRRLVNHRLGELTTEFSEFTYLLASGSDRIGALDFQESGTEFRAREVSDITLDDLALAAERIQTGQPLDERLELALLRGTSIGGARPKAMLNDEDGTGLIAKFSSSTDLFPTVQGEFVAMELARRAGLHSAPVRLTRSAGRWILLVERFDRIPGGQRRQMVSALTILKLTTFPGGRYATYVDLTHQIRASFLHPSRDLRELFCRIAFNMLCGNTDDHGRNHAAFVTAAGLELTPAYDICPQLRSGNVASQAMAFSPEASRDARLNALIDACHIYGLDRPTATDLIDNMTTTIREQWHEVCDLAELTDGERDSFMGRQFLNPHVFE
jgi:serine/threonine-protein kinase HipA